MKKYILVLATVVASVSAMYAQQHSHENCGVEHNHGHQHYHHSHSHGNVIVGRVIDMEADDVIPFATVSIVETGMAQSANIDGAFEFAGLDVGKYTVRAQAVGYITIEEPVEVTTESAAMIDLRMEVDGMLIGEVVVSASRNEVKRSEAPVVVSILNEKLFERTNSTDLARSLNFQSGLRVENNCQNCAFPQVRINGLEGPYSQVLINSRPVVSALSGVYALEQIPVNKPRCPFHSYHRDGAMRVDGNYGATKGYEPNSYGEWADSPEKKEPPLKLRGEAYNYNEREYDEDYYTQPGNLFRLMPIEEKQLLFENTARAMGDAEQFIKVRHIINCYKADPDYGKGVAKALNIPISEIMGNV